MMKLPGRRAGGVMRRLRRAGKAESYALWRRTPIRSNVVLYESYSGNDILCHPEAIFRALLRTPDMHYLRHVWVVRSDRQLTPTALAYSRLKNVEIVRYQSLDYFRHLATAKYLVNNVTFPWQFTKRSEQIYVNTWHGTPLKKMGYDVPGRRHDARNIVRNFLSVDYFISPNKFTTERMFLDSYKMRNIYEGAVIEEGSPRTDRHQLDDSASRELAEVLAACGIELGQRRVILYAPTWRGAEYANAEQAVTEMCRVVESIESRIDSERFVVLVKPHQVVAKSIREAGVLSGRLVENFVPTNALLGRTDVLVTDYSSIFFDFLSTGRPVMFYTPDIDEYLDYRGLYHGHDFFPGPRYANLNDLSEGVADALEEKGQPSVRYRDQALEFCDRDDGKVCDRIIDIVFRGNEKNYRVHRGFSDGRKKLLIYLGPMIRNGITTAGLNLLNVIDHDEVDVTALYPWSTNREKFANAARISESVRTVTWQGPMSATRLALAIRNRELRHGVGPHGHAPFQDDLWRDEWRRIFGDSRFDTVIDFNGYSPFWASLLEKSSAARKLVWMHNDLLQDANRQVHGVYPLKTHLEALFTHYSRFDKLVSVSDSLMQVNSKKLAEYAPRESFVAACNTINYRSILALAFGDANSVSKLDERVSTVREEPFPVANLNQDDFDARNSLEHYISVLYEKFPEAAVDSAIARTQQVRKFIPDSDRTVTFVTVGRLSPEKNHDRLLRAFKSIHDENRETRLVIIGGGPLWNDIRATIKDLGLSSSVTMTGSISNPYALMARSDCFVLSSDYEGQPMVLLEALVLGLPIVTTSFDSVGSAMVEGHGVIVDRSVGALTVGMRKFLAGDLSGSSFDAQQYNARASDEFYRQAFGESFHLGDVKVEKEEFSSDEGGMGSRAVDVGWDAASDDSDDAVNVEIDGVRLEDVDGTMSRRDDDVADLLDEPVGSNERE